MRFPGARGRAVLGLSGPAASFRDQLAAARPVIQRLACLAVLMPALQAAAPVAWAAPPPAPGHGRDVPFTLRANKVILPVRVGGSRELRIVLDSGMTWDGLLLYRSAIRDSIGMKNPARVSIGGAGSGPPAAAWMTDSMSFRVGDVTFRDQRVVVLDGDPMKEIPSDGVCGYSLLGRNVVGIDHARMLLTLYEPGEFQPDSAWTLVPMTVKANRIPWISIDAGIRGPERVPLSCYIDLASGETLELLTREGMTFPLPDSLQDVLLGRGLQGDIHGQRGRIAWLELGSHRLDDVTAAIVPATVRSRQPGADGIIGNGLLRRFHVVFDYPSGRLYARPNASLREQE